MSKTPSRHHPYYQGRGKERAFDAPALPRFDHQAMVAPAGYRASAELAAAVNIALELGMPLLVTGEPGLGKSQLAHSIAFEMGLGEVLAFVAKSDSQGKDLFYTYDTLGRFHAGQVNPKDDDPTRFLSFNALGRAILQALPKRELVAKLGEHVLRDLKLQMSEHGTRSVVLIDEIDKAPRDVPNDILDEIEQMRFRIPEIALPGKATLEFELQEKYNHNRPIVIITSNSEKGLPDPFLRRCVYHDITFPDFEPLENADDQITVIDIVLARLGARYAAETKDLIADVLALFKTLREEPLGAYRPSLAECLNFLDYLLPSDKKRLKDMDLRFLTAAVRTILLKDQTSQEKIGNTLADYLKNLPK